MKMSWGKLRWVLLAVLAAAVIAIYALLILRSGDEETGTAIMPVATGARTTPTRPLTQTTATTGQERESELTEPSQSGTSGVPATGTDADDTATTAPPPPETETVASLQINSGGINPNPTTPGHVFTVYVYVTRGMATSVTALVTGSGGHTGYSLTKLLTEGESDYWRVDTTAPPNGDYSIVITAMATDGTSVSKDMGTLIVRAIPL